MTEQLKPCPFCEGVNVIHSGYRMYCHACGAEGPDADSADESAAIAAWNRRDQPTQAGVEPVVVPEDVIAGALYDFLGYLTSRRTRITMSDRDDAGAAVDALVDWSKTRKIRLEDACVKNWEKYTHPPARVPLTDEELRMISKQQDPVVVLHHNVLAFFAHAIIAAYEAKNGIKGAV